MSEIRKTPVKVGGKNGIIVHDKLCADGPVDPVTGQPMIDPKTGEPYEGPNDDMAELMHDYLVFLRGNTMIDKGNSSAPRFGVLSLISMNTPIFVYDHPAFKKIANTAFTDGIHVFVDADFMRKLVIQENESDGRQSGVIFLLLHELMHKLYCHVDRLKSYPHDIANIAEDMVINGKLVKGFKLDPVKLLSEIGHGMKPEEAEKYHKMAEEVVAEMLLIQERKKQQQKDKKKKGGGGQGQPQPGGKGQGKGQGSGGQGQPGSSGQGDDDEEGEEEDQDMDNSGGQGDKDENGKDKKNGKGGGEGDEEEEYSPIHHISPEELLDIIEQEGLEESVGKKLNMPKAGDVEGIGKKKAQARLNDIDAVQTALSQASKANGQYPGQHIAESASELVSGLEKGKIVWKLGIRKHFLGDGLKLKETDDEAAIPWYLDRKSIGVDPFYMGALVPQSPDETVLCLVDTSGSTSGTDGSGVHMRKAFLSEALNLKKGVSSTGDTAREVVLMSADTVIRGEPLIINEHNVNSLQHDGVPIFGNGGTDFARCLKEALNSKIMQKKKVKSVIYFTDCCDSPPQRADFEEYINKGIRIVFVTTPGMWNEQWNRDVGTFAEVYCIEEGTQANLDKKDGDYNTNTRRNRM
jgi:predicted metal-dependent peptidase